MPFLRLVLACLAVQNHAPHCRARCLHLHCRATPQPSQNGPCVPNPDCGSLQSTLPGNRLPVTSIHSSPASPRAPLGFIIPASAEERHAWPSHAQPQVRMPRAFSWSSVLSCRLSVRCSPRLAAAGACRVLPISQPAVQQHCISAQCSPLTLKALEAPERWDEAKGRIWHRDLFLLPFLSKNVIC